MIHVVAEVGGDSKTHLLQRFAVSDFHIAADAQIQHWVKAHDVTANPNRTLFQINTRIVGLFMRVNFNTQ